MRLFVASPMRAANLVHRVRPEDYLVSIVCVLRTSLAIHGICTPLSQKKQPGPRRSEAHDDGLGNSPRFAGDLAPFKPRTDVTLMGSAHVPGGQKATFLPVTFGVNTWRKSLDIVGDRNLIRAEQVSFTPPESFSSMALRMENAFGGLKSPFNPWGKGFGILPNAAAARLPACNIHPAGHRHFDWQAKIAAGAFGPLPPNRPPRAGLRGTYDEAWLYKRNPLPPEDFDWGFHNAAPPDQQFSPYLRGDETLYFEHLHPQYPQFSSTLPGLLPRVLVRRETAEGGYQIEELRPALDSVHVDTDAMTVDLGWRAVTRSPFKEGVDLTHAYIASEPLSESARPLAEHVEAFEAKLKPPAIRMPKPPAEPGPSDEEKAEDEEEQVMTLKAAIEKIPFKAPFKDAVAAAETSQDIRQLIEAEGKRVMAVLEKAAKRKQ